MHSQQKPILAYPPANQHPPPELFPSGWMNLPCQRWQREACRLLMPLFLVPPCSPFHLVVLQAHTFVIKWRVKCTLPSVQWGQSGANSSTQGIKISSLLTPWGKPSSKRPSQLDKPFTSNVRWQVKRNVEKGWVTPRIPTINPPNKPKLFWKFLSDLGSHWGSLVLKGEKLNDRLLKSPHQSPFFRECLLLTAPT